MSKNGNLSNFNTKKNGPSFLTSDTRMAFNHLQLAFTKASILWHFNLECHIQIEIDASGYAISGVLSQLASKTKPDEVVTKTNWGQWHPVAFFSRKMIPVKTQYKTHDGKLLAIFKVFKIWRHYLKNYKHKVLIFIDHNNFCWFIDIKNLSSRQVCWAQKLF